MYLCFVYLSPTESTHLTSRDNLWNLLEEEIAYYQDKGHILLLGDFNARTASNFDYIELDSNNYVPLPDNYILDNLLPRVFQDTILNNYGKILLQLCIDCGLRIVNSRSWPDSLNGSFTYLVLGVQVL